MAVTAPITTSSVPSELLPRTITAPIFEKSVEASAVAKIPELVFASPLADQPLDILSREDSPTCGAVNEFFVGTQNPLLVQVPNLVYHGWKCISTEPSLVVNVPTEPYRYSDPDEFRLEPHGTLPYDGARKDG